MAQEKIEHQKEQGNLFLPVSDVVLAEIVEEAVALGCRFPEIGTRIRADQDGIGLAKKQMRAAHDAWVAAQTESLPGLAELMPGDVTVSVLEVGRPRMHSETVLVFFVISHYFNSVYSQVAMERLFDSLTIYRYLGQRGLRMPGVRTIGDNVNAVSAETRRFILQCQLQMAREDELDDFLEICGDSTSVEANTQWPTDSGLILRLLRRVFRQGQNLEGLDVPNLAVHWSNRWLKALKKLDFEINTAKRRRSRKKLYRRFLKTTTKFAWHLGNEMIRLHPIQLNAYLPPLLRERLDHRWGDMLQDLLDVCRIHRRCEERVLDGKRVKGSKRLLSLADRTAAYIIKGGRSPVIGYKPQLARSANGLVTGLLVEEGNLSDSVMCVPLVEESMALTGIVPAVASFDDGYTSAINLKKLTKFGIKHVSFSGSKGKRLLGEERWQSGVLSELRRFRSRVESLIYCLKHCHEFGELRRRGLEQAREELLGKAVVYNFCRIIVLRRRNREKDRAVLDPAA